MSTLQSVLMLLIITVVLVSMVNGFRDDLIELFGGGGGRGGIGRGGIGRGRWGGRWGGLGRPALGWGAGYRPFFHAPLINSPLYGSTTITPIEYGVSDDDQPIFYGFPLFLTKLFV